MTGVLSITRRAGSLIVWSLSAIARAIPIVFPLRVCPLRCIHAQQKNGMCSRNLVSRAERLLYFRCQRCRVDDDLMNKRVNLTHKVNRGWTVFHGQRDQCCQRNAEHGVYVPDCAALAATAAAQSVLTPADTSAAVEAALVSFVPGSDARAVAAAPAAGAATTQAFVVAFNVALLAAARSDAAVANCASMLLQPARDTPRIRTGMNRFIL